MPHFKTYFFKLMPLVIMLMFLSSCEKDGDPDCFKSKQVLTRIAFIAKDSVRVDSLIDSIYVDTTIIQFKDTLFENPAMISIGMTNNIISFGSPYNNYIGVPLNPDSKSMRYVLQYDTSIALLDTLTYFYHSSVHFISNNCGFTNYYHIDSIQTSRHVIDSVHIKQPEVSDKASDRHVYLYFNQY